MPAELFWALFFAVFLLYLILQWRMKVRGRYLGYRTATKGVFSQPDDVFTISGRMDSDQQWPTHDGRLSIHQLSLADNKPPGYNDAPPSYEEAMRLAMEQSLATSQQEANAGTSNNQNPATAANATATSQPPTGTTAVTIEVPGGS